MSGTRIRQKFAKKRNLHGVNEHFSQIFNAIIVPRSSRAKVSEHFQAINRKFLFYPGEEFTTIHPKNQTDNNIK